MLDDNVDPDTCLQGANQIEQMLTDEEYYVEKTLMRSTFHQKMLQTERTSVLSKYQEERTGLLSNRFHQEKYPVEGADIAPNDRA